MSDVIQGMQKILGYSIMLHNTSDIMKMIDFVNTQSFRKEKLEKDFYLTIILHRISREIPQISFKGGTCLNKVYFPYFRLSEDLDFSLSTENPLVDSNRKRKIFAHSFREKVNKLTNTMGRSLNDNKEHHMKAKGYHQLHNKSYTYLKYIITYPSIYDIPDQTIKIELTYTTKQYLPSVKKPIQSLFVDPVIEEKIFRYQEIRCLDLSEMIIEKCRACLTRRNPAIRDFFDLRYLEKHGIDILHNKTLIKEKCSEVNNMERTLLDQYHHLEKQIQTHLLPVVDDLDGFNLKDIYKKILGLQKSW